MKTKKRSRNQRSSYFEWAIVFMSFCCGYFIHYVDWNPLSVLSKLVDNTRKPVNTLENSLIQIQTGEKEATQLLYNGTKVLCWVSHRLENVEKRLAIMETWGRRCDELLFVIGDNGNVLSPVDKPRVTILSSNAKLVQLKITESYPKLWLKTKMAFKYIVETYSGKFGWVYKVDDDSFLVMENLKLFLRTKNFSDPFYYGCQLKLTVQNRTVVYASGGPGYVMSMPVAGQLVNTFSMDGCPKQDEGNEDVNVGVCLSLIGVRVTDSRDEYMRFRFIPVTPEDGMDRQRLLVSHAWFTFNYSLHYMQWGFECCSDAAISFHYVSPSLMRTLEYLIYYLHPFSSRQIWGRDFLDNQALRLLHNKS